MPLEEFARELQLLPSYHAFAVTPVVQSKRLCVQVDDRVAQSPRPGAGDSASALGQKFNFFSLPFFLESPRAVQSCARSDLAVSGDSISELQFPVLFDGQRCNC